VRFDSPKVSRHHARVIVSGRSVSIEDLGSKNGTFVSGARTSGPTPLAPGDEIQIGPVRLKLKIVDRATSAETEGWTRGQR
jgi:pSer/pThr/pTyr-binding forkhead associated (FHA) protein